MNEPFRDYSPDDAGLSEQDFKRKEEKEKLKAMGILESNFHPEFTGPPKKKADVFKMPPKQEKADQEGEERQTPSAQAA